MNRRRWMVAGLSGAAGAVSGYFVYRQVQAGGAGYRIEKTYPHDASAFCQGLAYEDGVLYESTGRHGRSSLRQVDLQTGKILALVRLKEEFFAEGLTIWNDSLVQLTWQNGVAFVYDRATLTFRRSFPISGEGWGLTHDGAALIMSDGTSTLRYLRPEDGRVLRTLQVRDGDRPIPRLNELEMVRGEIWANVWQSDRVVRISPETGQAVGWIDLAGLLPGRRPGQIGVGDEGVDVLNGIAYDAAGDRLFVTGKNWPSLFQIRVIS